MSKSRTGNVTHDNEEARVEGVRQSAVRAAGVSQATARAADIAYYRACLISARTNGVEQGVFTGALRDLGIRDV